MEHDVQAARDVTRLARHAEKALEAVDLTMSQYRVLCVLAEESGFAGSVASRLAVRPPSLTTVIDGLVARGLVEREPDPADGRRQVLALTALGQQVLATGDRAVAARLRKLAERVEGGHRGDADTAIAELAVWHERLEQVREERESAVRQ